MTKTSDIAEGWPPGTAVEVRSLDGWLPATVLGAGWQPPRVLRAVEGGDRIEVEMATGQTALISEAYNGRANIREAKGGKP